MKLHTHTLEQSINGEDVKKQLINSKNGLIEAVCDFTTKNKDKGVYVLCFERDRKEFKPADEYKATYCILIENRIAPILDLLENNMFVKTDNIFLFECPSYEDAYKLALSMREENPLCYNQDIN